jgi:hypothetical protein
MLFPISKKQINWVDGMKISRVHLCEAEDCLIDAVRDAVNIRLTGYNYGLLPPYCGEELSSDFEIHERGSNRIEIELRKCSAITAGGCRIDLNPADHTGYMTLDHVFEDGGTREQTGMWDVILVVRPFIRVPTGVPDPDETPPRHPYADRQYVLSIVPAGHVNTAELGMRHLIIGRIAGNGNRFVVDADYIPPCVSMMSHPDLKRYYEVFGKYMNDIEVASHRIVAKTVERRDSSSPARNTQLLCERILDYIALVYFRYRNMGRSFAPIEIADLFASLAHVCHVALNCIPAKEKEETLQYYHEWSEVTPGAFVELITGMLEATYDHNDIRCIMKKTDTFMSVFSSLWQKLASLEYIGQRRENIVISIHENKPSVEQITGWVVIN